MNIYVIPMILWGNDFQPEGLWIAAVWEFREQTLIYCCSSLHLMHTISILKIMVFSNLTISALSLCLPAILFSLSAVSVGVWCSSETDTLLFGFLVCLVETLGYSRNDNKHKLLYMRNRSWNSEALKHENYALICGLHHLPCAYAYLCLYYISLPDYPGSFFCLIPIPWCHIKHPYGISLSH